mmetsp:Transcript_25713/g.82781  ORF Transcript_25713/g.82781 Transcript_25713/m.82781 type:complete len:315 (-) Transcript_25713:19-963(-)
MHPWSRRCHGRPLWRWSVRRDRRRCRRRRRRRQVQEWGHGREGEPRSTTRARTRLCTRARSILVEEHVVVGGQRPALAVDQLLQRVGGRARAVHGREQQALALGRSAPLVLNGLHLVHRAVQRLRCRHQLLAQRANALKQLALLLHSCLGRGDSEGGDVPTEQRLVLEHRRKHRRSRHGHHRARLHGELLVVLLVHDLRARLQLRRRQHAHLGEQRRVLLVRHRRQRVRRGPQVGQAAPGRLLDPLAAVVVAVEHDAPVCLQRLACQLHRKLLALARRRHPLALSHSRLQVVCHALQRLSNDRVEHHIGPRRRL